MKRVMLDLRDPDATARDARRRRWRGQCSSRSRELPPALPDAAAEPAELRDISPDEEVEAYEAEPPTESEQTAADW